MIRSLAAPAVLSTIATLIGVPTASAEVIQAGPADDVEALMNSLQPGDELVLADGTYTLTGRFGVVLAASESAPILIRAAEGARPHFHRPDASNNIWDLQASHVEVRGLEFSGGSAGLRFEAGQYVTIRDCEIHDTADVALRMNDVGQVYESMRIIGNEIHHTNGTGEGMYLGCNNNGCQLANTLIERNHVHHTNQSSVSQGDGIEIKEGSYGNVIRDNVVHDTNYPCILTYSAAGNGPANLIERNLLWNCGDHGIQSAADATIRNNIILGAAADGIAMQPHQSGAPTNLSVVHNTVIAPANDALSLRGAAGDVVIANNALYAQAGSAVFVNGGDASSITLVGNVGTGGTRGLSDGYTDGVLVTDLVDAHYGGAPPLDAFPAAASSLIAAGDPSFAPADDFNGTPRAGVADVGAYHHAAGGNPGWALGEGLKADTVAVTELPTPPGGSEAGDPVPGGGDVDSPAVPGDTGDGPLGDAPRSEVGGGCTAGATPTSDGLALVFLALFALRRRK